MKELFEMLKEDRMLIKIIRFFYENPTCIDTIDNIADWIEEEKEPIEKGLDFLVEHKIMNKDSTYAAAGYSFTQDKDQILKIADFLEELGNA
ncbi:MAG: hypothetical protein P9M06_06815 [Candidatus Saelkia tenebricola]|nr:hypothetical protein [Candidatus Saelkia tenebricola]